MDRMALCSYLLTGQLGDAEVGSVVMFAIPPGAGARAQTEHFLQVSVLLCIYVSIHVNTCAGMWGLEIFWADCAGV